MRLRRASLFLSLLLATAAALPALADSVIEIDAPYARSAGPTAMTGAAYLVIRNTGDTDDVLTDVRSDAAARVELHSSTMGDDGLMRMEHLEDGLPVPAGSEVILMQGGRHVMFMGLAGPFEQGKTIPLTLVFDQAGEMKVEVPVDLERMPGAMDHAN
ncbi:copper chaperone PCu(A)C [Roseisalinus antarcticus]|uniref:Copper chaperone PCu(A)C n=1 Tax=Roseisalinus antarcticus TaxID=254357 RepID=A0A1Y5RSN3_9RHOB|nr:copper chaperone PCu(A)C [Roseisalinus antarcticus]SLN24465.1 hypothetical protein ROA7023_00754 [Roseisalinus antarcticus]